MRAGRPPTIWLALLTVVFYGLAPALACLTSRGTAPVSCLAVAVHTCACEVGSHAKDACCCGHGAPGGDGPAVKRLPCTGEPAADGAFWTVAHQLPAPVFAALFLPRSFRPSPPLLPASTWRDEYPDLSSPPPRTPALG